MPARRTILILALSFALSLALSGCSPADEPGVEAPVDGPAAGISLAPGLYDLEDGSVQAIGTLEWVDLEGGFWAVVGGTAAEGDEGATIAVIANGDEFDDEFSSLGGRMVSVIGERFDGASIRMAGPEIIAETVEEMVDTPGAAE